MASARPRLISFSELERWDVKYFSGRIKSKYPLVSLATFVREHNEKIRPFNFPDESFKILGVNNTDGIFHAYNSLGKEIKQPYKKVNSGDFAYNPYRVNVGSIGWVPPEHGGAFISPAYVVFSIDEKVILPELFWFILKSDFFNQTLRAATAGSVRMNLTYPLLETLKIPIPSLPSQKKIVAYWQKAQRSILRTAQNSIDINEKIHSTFLQRLGLQAPKKTTLPKCFTSAWREFDRWSVSFNQTTLSMIDLTRGKYPVVELGSVLELVQYGTSEKANTKKKGTPVLRMNNIKDGCFDYSKLKHIELPLQSKVILLLKEGDILINRTNSKELVGKCAVFHETGEYVFASYLIRLLCKENKANPDYIAHVINSVIGRQQVDALSRQVLGQANINTQELRSLKIPLPPLPIQIELMKLIEAEKSAMTSMEQDAIQIEKKSVEIVEKLILGTLSVEEI